MIAGVLRVRYSTLVSSPREILLLSYISPSTWGLPTKGEKSLSSPRTSVPDLDRVPCVYDYCTWSDFGGVTGPHVDISTNYIQNALLTCASRSDSSRNIVATSCDELPPCLVVLTMKLILPLVLVLLLMYRKSKSSRPKSLLLRK